MAKDGENYRKIVVESFVPSVKSGLHGRVHVRPVAGQGLSTELHVECSKKLTEDFPVGTKFRILAKLTDREGEGDYLYSYHGWRVEILR